MDQRSAQLRIFERLRKEAVWLRLPPNIFEDVVQEAWLLTLGYAAQVGKSLDDLSQTELKFRCLEARRKIRSPYQEKSLEEKWLELSGTDSDLVGADLPAVGEIVETEAGIIGVSPDRLDRLVWLLEIHPALKLTPHQRTLWDLMRRKGEHGWQADYARERAITRQAVSKTAAVIKEKASRAAALLRLAEGDIDYFFGRYGQEWNSLPLRFTLTELFRPRLGVKVAPKLIKLFLPLKKAIVDKAARVLEEEIRYVNTGNSPRPENLALGGNLFYLADHMEDYLPDVMPYSSIKSIAEEISRKGIIIGPYFNIAFKLYRHLYDSGSWVKKYIEWLNERFQSGDQTGKDYANYHLAYYHAVPRSKKAEFLRSVGRTPLNEFSYPEIISRTYINTRNSFYVKKPGLLDLNFLRLLLIKKHFPLEMNYLPLSSRHALKVLSQKALHSKEPLVVRGAEEILASVGV